MAAGDGIVTVAGWNGGYGQMVEIKHPGGWITRYAHLSRVRVQDGQKVEAGQRIGDIGSTGRSTGPHLHYEIRKADGARDPAPFLKTGKQINGLL
jgi:murein DD-endopeptidase MepM/ murein hydrolase activator NlpD